MVGIAESKEPSADSRKALEKSKEELSSLSSSLLSEVENKKQDLNVESYIECRHYINSVDDALVRCTEALRVNQWQLAEQELEGARKVLHHIKNVVRSAIAVRHVR